MCNGFRYDGSATFADQKRLDAGRAQASMAVALSGGGQYALALKKGGGKPALALLDRIARLARRAEAQGGRVILLLPPLMPGMEQALDRTSHSGARLRATKHAIEKWAGRERVQLLDAGRSESYGCTVDEFIDPHHALPGCYRKAFTRYFQDRPHILTAVTAGSR